MKVIDALFQYENSHSRAFPTNQRHVAALVSGHRVVQFGQNDPLYHAEVSTLNKGQRCWEK